MKILIILIAYTLNGQTGNVVKTEQVGGPYENIKACSDDAATHKPEHLSKDLTVTVFNCAIREVQGGGEDL